MNKEETKIYNKKYYHANKKKMDEVSCLYYQDNKEKIKKNTKDYYNKNKQLILQHMSAYNKNNKEKIQEYQREYNKKYRDLKKNNKNFKKILKARKIIPTKVELGWMNHGIFCYIKSVNKQRTFGKLLKENLIADAYEGLLNALRLHKPEHNKKNYIIAKIRFHLIDCYRNEYGRNEINGTRKGNKKLVYPNIASLDGISSGNNPEETIQEEFLIVKNDGKSEQEKVDNKIDADYFDKKIEKGFINSELKSRKYSGKKLYKIWKLRNIDNLSYREIGEMFNLKESCMAHIFLIYIIPIFKVIQVQILKDNPSWY